MSDPCFRDIITRSLSPNLASTTLMVNVITVICGLRINEYAIMDGIMRISDSMVPSSIRRDIRRWFWWIIRDVIMIIGKIVIIDNSWFGIEINFRIEMFRSVFGLQDQCFISISFRSFKSDCIDLINYGTQSHCFS